MGGFPIPYSLFPIPYSLLYFLVYSNEKHCKGNRMLRHLGKSQKKILTA